MISGIFRLLTHYSLISRISLMRLKYCVALFVVSLCVVLVGCGTLHATSIGALPPTTSTHSPSQTIATPTSPIVTPSPVASSTTNLEVYFLDVGQGDSEILRYGNNTMLIDAGTNASTSTLISDIKELGISRFDTVIATHPHEDHIGGLDTVINQFNIGTIYMPKVTTTTKTFLDVLQAIKNKGLTITTPVPGSAFNLGSDTCTILAPNSQSYADLNSYSIVLRVVNGNNSFLFTGDAQVDSEMEMLSKGYTLKSDVLKVGHHGSSTSTSPDFLKAVSPKYAVIEVGAGNDYGHPHQVTLDKLNSAGVKIYRTDLNGIIAVISNGSNISINTEK
jgi:competence protein ComEC